ncbi:uncharacterized protein SETTUDRAFT_163469 [Exserohilum turcica Et28A]|uniref:Uncharacterized protein n=1 Tax=Exserohilum turcicum (strain 28A) TaxID=671987 RepID=R0IHV2_EXST2|nr:uncharacterized protein SETTUDRAFT_163469 [Exserohilum turcica Et28A]EOA84551.1 hypothetical protein SETTUDRAFT_163469 [Exserohilum turcica Et28A]
MSAAQAYLEGKTSVNQVTQQLATHVEAAPTPVELKVRLDSLWEFLNDTAVALPAAQEPIITLLKAIKTLPQGPEPEGEGKEHIDLDDGEYWKELTGWANIWADNFNSYAVNHSRDTSGSQDRTKEQKEKVTKWKNACEYGARLIGTGDEALASYGAGIERAAWAIASGLEVDVSEKPDPDGLEAAAQVFLHAKEALYSRCKEGPKEGIVKDKASVWKGENSFTLERWAFWKEQWKAVTRNESIPAHTRGVAESAIQAMEGIEG